MNSFLILMFFKEALTKILEFKNLDFNSFHKKFWAIFAR